MFDASIFETIYPAMLLIRKASGGQATSLRLQFRWRGQRRNT